MRATLAEELDLQRRDTLARVTTIVLLFGITYQPVFVTLYGKYVEADSYYSHGFLIPLLSGFVIWSSMVTAQQFTRLILPLLPAYLTERSRAGGGQ